MKKKELKAIIEQQSKQIHRLNSAVKFYERKNQEVANYINIELAKISHR